MAYKPPKQGPRRPSQIQRGSSWETHMRNEVALTRSGSRSPDFGPENFSYDPVHLAEWAMPEPELNDELPPLLQAAIRDWSLAGAALCTALDRIDNLHDEAVERGWPRDKPYARLSRQASGGAASGTGAPTSSLAASPIESPMMLPTSVIADRFGFGRTYAATPPSTADSSHGPIQGFMPGHPTPVGMESPPCSPIDSAGACSPAQVPTDTSKATLPDLSKLQLSPPLTRCSSGGLPAPSFDENAWETYINRFRAELNDVRCHALSRWKGFARSIDKYRHEFSFEHVEYREPIGHLEEWWSTVEPRMRGYEARVKALEVPDLEEVKEERVMRGLPL